MDVLTNTYAQSIDLRLLWRATWGLASIVIQFPLTAIQLFLAAIQVQFIAIQFRSSIPIQTIFPRNPASGAQHNPAADTHSVRSPLLSTHFDNFRMPQRPHGIFSESSNILEDEISFDFEAVETLKHRLDQEKRAREFLEQKFQQLQSNFEATHEEIQRKNQTNTGMPSKKDVDFLMNTVRH